MQKKRETKTEVHERAQQIIRALNQEYKDPKCALNHSNVFELLLATILSAQCTDERVNIVTANLFRKYRRLEDYVNAPRLELESDIRSTGFFRNKTKSLQGACKVIIEQYGGRGTATLGAMIT